MLTSKINSTTNENERFSPAFLIQQWANDNGKNVVKTKKEVKKTTKERKYKDQSGRISKDGKTGFFDVDSRGRLICV